jgi:signal transduction histidine kinase
MLVASTGSFHLLVENGTAFEMVYVAGGRIPEEQTRWQRYPADLALPVTEVVRSGRPLWLETVDEWKTRYPQLADYADVYQGAAATLPLLVKGQAVGAVAFIFPNERTFSQEDRDFMLALSYQCAQALERARLYETERQSLELLQARVRLQSLISELGRQALIASDMPALMNQTVSLLAQTLDVEYAKILEFNVEDNNLLLKAGVGWKDGLVGQATVSAGSQSQAGFTLMSNGPVIVEDLRAETRFDGPSLLTDHGVVSGITVIIQGFERQWGVLGIHTTRQRAFTQDDVYFLQSVANIIGAAIERARLQERTRQAAVVEERHRLARDLHDAVSQALFSASVLTETLPKLMEKQPTKVPGVLSQVHQLVKGASSELRILLYELRPETLVRNNIAELVGQLVDAAQAKRSLTISYQAEGDHALSQEVKVALFRIAQESLTNILKHSEATEVSIFLHCQPERTELRVQDNGRGFDPQQLSSGMGLVGMRERAQQIGARLAVTSAPGDGTEITFALDSEAPSGAAASSSAT